MILAAFNISPKNFATFTGKQQCGCHFLVNLQVRFTKKTPAKVFTCEFFKSAFYKEHLWATASEEKT